MIARPVAVAAAWLLITAAVLAQSLPTLTAPVNDFAKVIDAKSAAEMDRRIRSLQAATGDAVVVVTVRTFQPYGSIEEYAVQLFERAGIGQKGKDNGTLILLAVDDRRARIEVGYEIEGFVSAGFAGETIRQEMLPAFRNGDYGAGLLAGTTRIIQRIAEGRGVTLTDVPPARKRSSPFPGVGVIVIVLILFLIIARNSRRRGPPGFRGPRGPWSGWHGGVGGFGGGWIGGMGGGFGGGGGGGFGGFGGGRSGGGGASGGW
jgi:uncharacterized protein